MRSDLGICEATGKRCYPSRQQAKEANRHNGQRMRVYFCDTCHGHHTVREQAARPPRLTAPRGADKAFRAGRLTADEYDELAPRGFI